MELYLNLLANLFWLNILLAILVVFFGRKDPQSTAFWIMVLAFIPVIGFFSICFWDKTSISTKCLR